MEIGYFIKKRNENKKNFFDEKQQKNAKKVYVNTWSSILWCERAPLNFRDIGENVGDKILKVEHTLHVQPEGLSEG